MRLFYHLTVIENLIKWLYSLERSAIFVHRKSTHSKVDASGGIFSSLSRAASPVGRQERHFFYLFFRELLKKVSSAITNDPRDIKTLITLRTIMKISYIVISLTSFHIIKKKIKIREHATLSWALFLHICAISV